MTESTKQPTAPTPCSEREEALALHAGRDLPPAEARELEEHLGRCPGCRGFLEELEESRSALTAFAAMPPTAGLSDVRRRVMEEVRDAESPRGGLSGRHRHWLVAAAVVLALATVLVWRLGPSPESPGEESVWVARSEPPEGPEPPRISPTPEPTLPEPTQPEPIQTDSERPEPTPREPRPTASTPETEIRRASTGDRPDLKIQLVSDDPDIVIYWLVDMEEPSDAPTDAPSTT